MREVARNEDEIRTKERERGGIAQRQTDSTIQQVSFAGENFHEFRISVVIHDSFLRENLFSNN